MRKLSFGEPFIETRYLEGDMDYVSSGICILVNLDEERNIVLEGEYVLKPLSSMLVREARISVPGKALLICNIGTIDLDDLLMLDALRKLWKSNWELTHLEKHRGQPYYKSAKETIGNVSMNFCLVSEPSCPSGIHKEHAGPIHELHVQIAGDGAVDLMRSDDPDSMYASLPLAAGSTHLPTWDKEGNYPWHRYRSISRSIFLAVEVKQENAG